MTERGVTAIIVVRLNVYPSRPYPITPFNADSALAEYLATTIGQRPDGHPAPPAASRHVK
jgi:hypothetical protein